MLEKAIKNYPEEREAALKKCIEEKLWSANDFRDVAAYIAGQKTPTTHQNIPTDPSASLFPSASSIIISIRSINEYTKILGGKPE